jgi:4-diphosphocytidyl-2-C-methyl-D-erythritol kinase
MKKVKLKSLAKVNLTLEVIERLSNGFHELRSIILKLSSLYDELEVVFDNKKNGIEIRCNKKDVPTNENNIVWKIAEKFFEKSGKRIGLQIKIKKNIPVAAGLGGGSSNGASVLIALNNYFGKPFSFQELVNIAAEIGKDIPAFLFRKKMIYVFGAGEKIKKIKKGFRGKILLVKLEGHIKTSWAYKQLDKELVFMNNTKRVNLTNKFLKNISNLEKCAYYTYNDFEVVAQKKYPQLETIQKTLLAFGALSASITGKGPTVFGIFRNKKEALKMQEILKKYYPKLFIKLG